MIFKCCPVCMAEDSGIFPNPQRQRSRSASRDRTPDSSHCALRARSGSLDRFYPPPPPPHPLSPLRPRSLSIDSDLHLCSRTSQILALKESSTPRSCRRRVSFEDDLSLGDSNMPCRTPCVGWYSGEVTDYGLPNGVRRMCLESDRQR